MKPINLFIFIFTSTLLFNCESEITPPVKQDEFIKSNISNTNIVYEYQEPGHILKQKSLHPKSPNMVRYEDYDSLDGKIDLTFTNDYYFDDYGNIFKIISYDYLDRFTSQSFYDNVYDSYGRLIQTQDPYSTSRGIVIVSYEYNSDGTIKAQHKANNKDTIQSEFYNILNGGQTIEVLSFNTALNDYSVSRSYIYNDNNKLKQIYYNPSSPNVFMYEFEYDQNGNLTETLHYYQNEYTGSAYFKYDDFGRKIKTSYSDRDYYFVYEYSNDNFIAKDYPDPFFYFEYKLSKH